MGFFSLIVRLIKSRRDNRTLHQYLLENPEKLREARETVDTYFAKLNEYQMAQLHRGTGTAITAWAGMEERLIMIASLLLQTSLEKTGLVFYSIINFQVWIAVITELFNMEPDLAAFQKRWNKIYERLRAEKDYRDRLAHNPVVSEEKAGLIHKTVKKAPILDTRAKSRSFVPMDAESVIQFAERIGDISDDLLKLVDDMTGHIASAAPCASRDKSSEPNRDQPA